MAGVLRRLGRGTTTGPYRRRSRERGFVEAGVAVTGAALVLGAALGSGVASSVVTMADGITWLPDDANGQVVQINPATGLPERRLQVAGPGGNLTLAQRDGVLLVTDATTGQATTIDLATLLAGSRRDVGTGTRVLVGDGRVYLVELTGLVRAVDPLTLNDLGSPLRTAPLSDAVVDGDGALWVLREDGGLLELAWSPTSAEFSTTAEHELRGVGRQARMTAHGSGVTVFAPDGGVVSQVGAGRDLAVRAPGLDAEVLPALESPASLAPAAVPTGGAVVMISGGDLLEVDVARVGCARPGTPAVFSERVYVPCTGDGRVIVLGPDGRSAGADILVPDGRDPRLLVDDGRLFIHSESSTTAVMVEADGSSRQIRTGGGGVPVQDVDTPPVAVPPPDAMPPSSSSDGPGRSEPTSDPVPPSGGEDRPGRPTSDEGDRDGDAGPGGTDGDTGPGGSTDPDADPGDPGTEPDPDPTSDPDPTTDPDPDPDPDPDTAPEAPSGVTAHRVDASSAQVSWAPPTSAPDEFVVEPQGGGPAVTVPGDRTGATVTGLPCGSAVRFTVTAVVLDPPATAPSAPSAPVTTPDCPPTAPTAATGVTATPAPDGSVTVAWTPASSGADAYVVAPQGGSGTQVAGTSRQVTLTDVPPGAGVRFVVQTRLGGASVDSAPSNAVTVAGAPGAPGGVSASLAGRSGDQLTVPVSWSRPADNGSPVTGLTVQYSGGGVSGQVTTTGTSVTLTIGCAGRQLCTSGGTLNVSVTATNGVGSGPAGTATVSVPAPPPPPPAPGDVVVTSAMWSSPGLYDEQVPVHAYLDPPAGWAAHAGGCELHVAGGISNVRAIACSASGQVYLGAADGGSSVTVVVRALGVGGRTVDSAAASVDVPPRNTWGQCDLNTRICTDPVSLTPGDGVEIVPLPWTPVPGLPGGPARPPVLLAGIGLLATSGAVRALRLAGRRDDAHPTTVTTPEENR